MIRLATLEDLQIIARLERTVKGFDETDVASSKLYLSWQKAHRSHGTVIHVHTDRKTGDVTGTVLSKPEKTQHGETPKRRIVELFVETTRRRHGIGTLLLGEALRISDSQNADTIVSLHRTDAQSIRLYSNYLFRLCPNRSSAKILDFIRAPHAG